MTICHSSDVLNDCIAGFGSDRGIFSSRTLQTSANRMGGNSKSWSFKENKNRDQVSCGNQKKLINGTRNVVGHLYGVSLNEGKSKEQKLESCLQTVNLKNSKYESGGKYFMTSRSMDDARGESGNNRAVKSKIQPNPKVGFGSEGKKLGLINDVVSSPLTVSRSSRQPCSKKRESSHSCSSSLSSSTRESPDSVIRHRRDPTSSKVLGSTFEKTSVSSSELSYKGGGRKAQCGNVSDNTKSHVNLDKRKGPVLIDPKNERYLQNNDRNCFRNGNILSFGNIYTHSKNMVNEHYPSNSNNFKSDMIPSFNSGRETCEDLKATRSNNHILGLGKGNYGHGSIIKGVKNLESLMGTNYSNDDAVKRAGKPTCTNVVISQPCLSTEQLKNAGNEEYKRGRFTEAISLYDKVIALCPRNAPCHSNKAAALAGLGRLSDAVEECREAIKCDPFYSRAHYRLGILYARYAAFLLSEAVSAGFSGIGLSMTYFRLGRVEDAKQHFKLSGQKLDVETMRNLLNVETHLINMKKAHSIEDWNRVLTEGNLVIDAGADASFQVLTFKAEALLKLHKATEALELIMAAKTSEVKKSTSSCKGDVRLLIIETQVHMYLGRFDDGVIAAECAVNLDCVPDSLMWLTKALAVADARKTGNEFFKAGKYLEACIAYGRGLEDAPMNSVLLCNRAACKSKLGQWEMAIEDCNAALRNRPDYTKALLRRAHSNATLGRWEESLRDYEVLSHEMPGDLSIARSLFEVQLELRKTRGQKDYNFQLGGQVIHLYSHAQFLEITKSGGLALLQFYTKSDGRCKQLVPLVNELCKKYPSWNFLKVDIEENPDWARIERVNFVPVFIIYKDGLKLREICSPDQHVLEHALNLQCL